jgi:hypothetical protein
MAIPHENLTQAERLSRWELLRSPLTSLVEVEEIAARWQRPPEWNDQYGPPMLESPAADMMRLLATVRYLDKLQSRALQVPEQDGVCLD